MSKIHFHNEYETEMDRNIGLGSWGSDITGGGANQLGMMNKVISSGQGYIEASALQKKELDKIPKQHWDEMHRLAKLTGTKVSLHGPMMDVIGMTPTGISEDQRKEQVNKIVDVLQRGYQLNPEGNTPVNFHATAMSAGEAPAGTIYRKGLFTPTKEQEEQGLKPTEKLITYAIDTETGQMQPLAFRKKYHIPETEEEKKKGYHEAIYTPERSLQALNRDTWEKEIKTTLAYEDKIFEIDNNIKKIERNLAPLAYGKEKGVLTPEEEGNLVRSGKQIELMSGHIEHLTKDMDLSLQGMYDTLHRYYNSNYINDEEKARYKKFLDNVSDVSINFNNVRENIARELKREYLPLIEKTEDLEEKRRLSEEFLKKVQNNVDVLKVESREIANIMAKVSPPKRFVPLEDYSIEKGSQTFADAAVKAYQKWGEKAPLIVIENPPAGQFDISRADKLREMIVKTRERFVEQVKDKVGEQKAREISENLIGATWDVGHINLLKSMGYSDEDIAEETKKITPLVKHWHITDNFGETDNHLAPGMGNVPFDKIVQYFEKDKKAFKILEAGQYIADFKESPFPYLLEEFNSPMYSLEKYPTWRGGFEIPTAYGIGFGEILPQQHFDMYGSGFATLPRELGGQVSGKSRFSETPNE